MIDRIFKTVQAIANKEQLGYIKPYKFNLYLNQSIYTVYNKIFSDAKTQVRKSNWMLDGKNLADYSEFYKELLEFYLKQDDSIILENGKFQVPDDFAYFQDLYSLNNKVTKVDLQDFNLLKRNNYASPKSCNPVCCMVGNNIKTLPSNISSLELTYIRKPKLAKWTFDEVDSKPMFDPTKDDFQDVDMPEVLINELVMDILQQAGVNIRDVNIVNYATSEESKEVSTEIKQ